ncbi:hypothetical protein [Mycoplasmoides pirum]|uniref:hypothetical protein n=1 Tax=Mycoplasmoides pirum TaxID=2122 RepID=UPI000484E520|nr:hypothetical protein [Mycoplasmoides pirum]
MNINFLKPAHALLIITKQGSYLKPILINYSKKIVCLNKTNDNFCDQCSNCEKINNEQYFDFNVIDNSNKTISKESILHLQNNFIYKGLEEGNKKIYLIKEIEKASKEAINSLLKFLEEPPSNTYAILTTKNEELVPPTILSRCQRFLLLPEKKFDWKEISEEKKLSISDLEILSKIYWLIDDVIKSIDDKSYLDVFNISKGFLVNNKSLSDLKKLQNEFKNLSYSKIELVLNYLLLKLNIDKYKELLEILNIMNLNPIRNAIFWKIIKLIER